MGNRDGILVVCAMGMEAKALGAGWRVVVSGPGFRAARRALEKEILQERPRLVLSVGTCGALDPALRVGDVRVVRRVESELGSFGGIELQGESAVLWSQDRVAVTAADKRALFERGAQIVDMEAAALAEVCGREGIEFGCLKAVSDGAEEDLPLDFNLYRDEAGGFHTARIAIAGIMKITNLLRLRRQSLVAVEQLGAALDAKFAEVA